MSDIRCTRSLVRPDAAQGTVKNRISQGASV